MLKNGQYQQKGALVQLAKVCPMDNNQKNGNSYFFLNMAIVKQNQKRSLPNLPKSCTSQNDQNNFFENNKKI